MGGGQSRPSASMRKPRCAAITALGMMQAESFETKLMALTTDPDWEVRACVAEALGDLGSGAGSVAACLDDDTYAVRAKACKALGKMKSAQQVARVADMLGDTSQTVRIEALRAIAGIGEPGQQYLGEVGALLFDPLNAVKGAAAKALGQMNDSGSYASTIAALLDDEDPFLRLTALETLPKMGNYGAAFADDVAV